MESLNLETLRRKILRWEGARHRGGEGVVSSGCQALDALLPERGLRRGAVAEWFSIGSGAGADTLALLAAREACREGGMLIVVDCRREFYPPAAVRLGIPVEQLLLVHATGDADNLWALDQSLRCRGAAAVLAWPEKLDGRTFRRFQLAAEESGTLGLFVRSDAARNAPSWAGSRFLVEPLPSEAAGRDWRRLRIHVLRCRGGGPRSVDIEINEDRHETRRMHLVAAS